MSEILEKRVVNLNNHAKLWSKLRREIAQFSSQKKKKGIQLLNTVSNLILVWPLELKYFNTSLFRFLVLGLPLKLYIYIYTHTPKFASYDIIPYQIINSKSNNIHT